MSENLKKLTGKFGFEPVAQHLVNDCDIALFQELTESESFLFDFVKQNVADRIGAQINENNYKNLIEFLKFYSPSYEDVIVSALVKYADEDLTDLMLEKFENGTDDEKTYCARFFGAIQDPLAYNCLLANAYADDEFLAQNCASSLALWKDEKSYNDALEKLKSADEFEKLSAVKFLSAYGNKEALPEIFKAMRSSAMAENIAGEIPYIENLFELLDKYYENALLTINFIINGLGEILPLSAVFDYELFEVFERLINNYDDSKTAIVLLNARDKFDTLTENDEYLFDESKDTKQEVLEIKNLLDSVDLVPLYTLADDELKSDGLFVFTALELTEDTQKVRSLLTSSRPAVIVKSLEILRQFDELNASDKETALKFIADKNIINIISAM